ncbi:MAG: hypothetical protein GEU75_08430 [Dehalococcoidia bacterium]|nr:hypothetical protein [Dehalococcoidia bacterium]
MTMNKGDPKVDALTEKELAGYFEENKDNDEIWQKKGRKIRARRGPSTVFQMRIAPDELEEITLAAEGNVSDFIRTAALEKARRNRGQPVYGDTVVYKGDDVVYVQVKESVAKFQVVGADAIWVERGH